MLLPPSGKGTRFLKLGSDPETDSIPEKATYPILPICSATKPWGEFALARLQSLHDSGSNGVEAKKVASISLVSNLPILNVNQEKDD